jgi:hypothetical protein
MPALPDCWLFGHAMPRRFTTTGSHGDRQTARVNTYGEVIEDYAVHPEAKSADARGRPCSKATIGLLQRRHVTIDGVKLIGKESNSLEDVQRASCTTRRTSTRNTPIHDAMSGARRSGLRSDAHGWWIWSACVKASCHDAR